MSRRKQSLTRAMRRGMATSNGVYAPSRPFNNKANTSKRKGVHSRTLNELKKRIYASIINRAKRTEERGV